jgi:hypothetical protein
MEFDVCIKEPVAEPVSEMAAITPVAVVSPEDPTLKVLDMLTEITAPVDVPPEFVIRGAELD